MKKILAISIFLLSVLPGGECLAQDSLNLRTVGVWPYGLTNAVNKYISGGHDYILMGSGRRISLLNVDDPAHPCITGETGVADDINKIWADGNYAYTAHGHSGVSIIDLTDPHHIRGSYKTEGPAKDIEVRWPYAYVAVDSQGLTVLNISDPADPFLVSRLNFSGETIGIGLGGNYAFLASGGNGVRVLNIGNPNVPTLIASCNSLGYVYDVSVSGSYAYVAAGDSGLRVMDISNISAPVPSSKFKFQNKARAAVRSGDNVFVAGDFAGLRIINAATPGKIGEVGYFKTAYNVVDLCMIGDHAFLADRAGGLRVIDVSQIKNPVPASSTPRDMPRTC